MSRRASSRRRQNVGLVLEVGLGPQAVCDAASVLLGRNVLTKMTRVCAFLCDDLIRHSSVIRALGDLLRARALALLVDRAYFAGTEATDNRGPPESLEAGLRRISADYSTVMLDGSVHRSTHPSMHPDLRRLR